jgi:hypothetical protein
MQEGTFMRKHAVKRRRLKVMGGAAALGLAATRGAASSRGAGSSAFPPPRCPSIHTSHYSHTH